MEQSPSLEANRFSASQEIPHILWTPNVHYHFRKCPPSVPIQNHIATVHAPTPHFLKIHHNILPSRHGFSKWSLHLRFPHRNPVFTSRLRHTCYMFRTSHSSITRTVLGDEYRLLIIFRSIIIRRRNVLDKRFRENQNSHFMFNHAFRTSCLS
jgi:hypothetical protein